MGDVSNFRLADVTAPVPEPATMTLLAAGLGSVLVLARAPLRSKGCRRRA